MRFIAAILFALALSTPAMAANELQGSTVEEFAAKAKTHGITVEKLNDADSAMLDAAIGPRPFPDTDIYIVTLRDQVIVVLAKHDGEIVFNSSPQKLEILNRVLGRTGA